MATAVRRLLTVDEFLELEFSGVEGRRVELDNGVIRMMAGGNAAHSRIQQKLITALAVRLKGTGCSPYGSDMGVRTHDLSLRYPDVAVFCGRDGPENDSLRAFDDPGLIAEILSPTTRDLDLTIKLREYCAIPSLRTILFVDPQPQTIRLLQRNATGGWQDSEVSHGGEMQLTNLKIALGTEDIFGRA